MNNRRSRKRLKSTPTTEKPLISERWCLVLLAAVILLFSIIRFRLREIPLERDEGEYAYAGQLLLQGIPPYKLAYNMKLPGTYVACALLMAVFGQSPAGIHTGLILINAVSVILIFLLARKLIGPLAGLASASSFALLSTSESVLGLAAHATHFVVLAAVAGILVLLRAMATQQTRLYFCGGLLLGAAFVLKQPGLLFVLFGALYLIVSEWRGAGDWRRLASRLAIYATGAVLPFALTCLSLYLSGTFDKMWFWTFSYGRQYASIRSLSEGWRVFLIASQSVIGPCLLAWLLGAAGVAAFPWDSRSRKHGIFLIAFLLFSFLAVCPGLYFREHYFILLLPAVSLFVGLAVSSTTDALRRHVRNPLVSAIPVLVLLGALVFSLENQDEILFARDPLSVSRAVYGTNPFPEALTISEYLHQHTKDGARIAVLGSEPEIYFYSKRHSATGYIYAYPLVEAQAYALDMQQDMAREIEAARPDYMVFVKVNLSWLPTPGSSTYILDWFRSYARANYEMIGIADEISPNTRFVWGDAVKTYHTQSESSIQIFKRRD